jgi:hypothetical protein
MMFRPSSQLKDSMGLEAGISLMNQMMNAFQMQQPELLLELLHHLSLGVYIHPAFAAGYRFLDRAKHG